MRIYDEEHDLYKYEKLLPQTHGYKFEGMYNRDVSVDLATYALAGFYFDSDDNFAGL